ncbi:threonine/serine exporter family protein [uncultured Maribacter sp.]|uniref:threonine/serine exporter family protein n=1 Tax=uncultured Maribacter sp. TaxID=431308 RepID=UPI0026120D66|nr:threonine/serine exporter family protein [uncultured Maribacter sp.]
MIPTLLNLLEVAIWSGIAAVGFAILFNIPRKAIITVFLLALGAGFIKFVLLDFHINIILASLTAASFVGLVSMPLAHRIHLPPVVYSIPAVIPMIPGYFAYETVLSIMSFIFLEVDVPKRTALMQDIFSNGFTMLFILISLTIGVSLPLLLLRKNTVKKIKR